MATLPDLDWMIEAKRHLGMNEKQHLFILDDWLKDLKVSWLGKNPAWCGIFVAKVFQNCNMKYPKEFYRAASYRNFGTQLSTPAYGCLAIKQRKGGDHVAFVVGKTIGGKLVCLGGNQSDSVCYATYNKSDFDCFVWVGKGLYPNIDRYNLSVLSVNIKNNVSEA